MAQSPQCMTCIHHHSNVPVDEKEDLGIEPGGCRAFPERIPGAILDGGFNHSEPYPGDQGFRWEQDPEHPDWVSELDAAGGDDEPEREPPHFSPVCNECEHIESTRGRTCAAFPEGIPMIIWLGHHDHKTKYVGDEGFRFSQVSKG